MGMKTKTFIKRTFVQLDSTTHSTVVKCYIYLQSFGDDLLTLLAKCFDVMKVASLMDLYMVNI